MDLKPLMQQSRYAASQRLSTGVTSGNDVIKCPVSIAIYRYMCMYYSDTFYLFIVTTATAKNNYIISILSLMCSEDILVTKKGIIFLYVFICS